MPCISKIFSIVDLSLTPGIVSDRAGLDISTLLFAFKHASREATSHHSSLTHLFVERM